MFFGSTETDKKTPELEAKRNKSKKSEHNRVSRLSFRPGQSTISRTLAPNLAATNNTIQIINLSKKTLTDAEQKLLEKGLKFTPTSEKENTQELKEDLFEFTRKVRLAEYFYGTEDTDTSLVKNKSNFTPAKYRNLALERYIDNLYNIPVDERNHNISYNISMAERNAIKTLANNDSIIIKEADKGGEL